MQRRTELLPTGYEMTITPQPWIPVSERLPPDETVVLAWSGKRVAFGYMSDGQWIDTLYGWVIPLGPSHWMPLPEPPTD